MRPLVMDFRTDVRADNIGDQFMYGPALLVNPVTEPSARTRELYLPRGRWYDFWDGTVMEGGRIIEAKAPLDRLPLYLRAGSILPMGPVMEWSGDMEDPIELRVCRGANGDFRLYEDENDNYHYEQGVHATIPLHWDDGQRTLTIGERQGQFPGMLERRSFRVVLVDPNHGTGVDAEAQPDKVVEYSGSRIVATL